MQVHISELEYNAMHQVVNLIANLTIKLLLALHSGVAGVYEIIRKKVNSEDAVLSGKI